MSRLLHILDRIDWQRVAAVILALVTLALVVARHSVPPAPEPPGVPKVQP